MSISDLDKAARDFGRFRKDAARSRTRDDGRSMFETDKWLTVSPILTPPKWKFPSVEGDREIVGFYDSLVRAWLSPLSNHIPSRVRISAEKITRNMAGQLCLASYTACPYPGRLDEDSTQDEISATGASFTLAVRGKPSAANEGKGTQPAARPSSKRSTDINMLPPSPLSSQPTPELTPSPNLPGSDGLSTVSPASQCLQRYAKHTPQPPLPIKLSKMLDQWTVGEDPALYDWEAAQQALASDDEEDLEARSKKRRRAEKRLKRVASTSGSSCQPLPMRLGASQPQQIGESISSQATDAAGISSQRERGKHGGRLKLGKKGLNVTTRRKPAGFR